jgi:tetratricopeptide (TPR) repeat protein
MARLRRYSVVVVSLALATVLIGGAGIWRYYTTRPAYCLRHGQEALLQGNVDKAERYAARLESLGYADHAHLLRGQTYLRLGQLNLAILEYNAIDRNQVEILAEASLIYGLGFLSLGRPVEAEKFLLYVAYARPGDKDAHRGLATIYYDRGAMRKALTHLEKWSDLDDRDGWSHRFMGLIYRDVGAKGPAVEHYQAALARTLPPRARGEVVVELAEVLIQQTEFAEALACLDSASLESAEAPAALPELRAECLYGLARGAEALSVLEQNRGSEPSARWLRLRAQLHAHAGETSAAAALLEKALRTDPHDCACRYQLALVYERLGRRTEAAEQRGLMDKSQRLFLDLIELNQQAIDKPTDAKIRRRLAEVCDKLGKHELAQMWLRAAETCPEESSSR